RTAWAALAFFLALLSKENAIVLPAILLLPSPFGRGQREGRAARALQGEASTKGEGHNPETLTPPSPRGRGWIRVLPLVFVALAYLLLRYSVLGSLGIPV